MKPTIENINGELFTVVWHRELKPTWKTEWYRMNDSYALMHVKNTAYHIATALPALPRNPKPGDAALLYRYMAEGLRIIGVSVYSPDAWGDKEPSEVSYAHWPFYLILQRPTQINHAIHAETGERVEIAIKENPDANT